MQNPYSRYQKNQSFAEKKKKKVIRITQRQATHKQKSKNQQDAGSIQWSFVGMSFLGLAASFYIFNYTDEVLNFVNRMDVGVTHSLAAEEENSSTEEAKSSTESTPLPVGKVSNPTASDDHLTMKNANIFKALKDKRRELEKKERRLAQLEEELQIQKEEIEKQLKEMQEMRRNISSKLDKKVTADQESIDKLVGVYSNMKPQNAALILMQVEDDLAVQVLAKMNKTNAAAILNFVDTKKAQYLSEKFTGLKK